MKADDYNKLIKSIVAPDFVILKSCTEEDCSVELMHTCGHRFIVSASDIAQKGVTCNRCHATDKEKLLVSYQEKAALQIYQECMNVLGAGHEIKGDTSSYDNVVTVFRIGKNYYDIKIDDLLHYRNVPVYLMKCMVEDPSAQLQLLQMVAGKRFLVLSDFVKMDDEILVVDKDNERLYKTLVKTLVEWVRSGAL